MRYIYFILMLGLGHAAVAQSPLSPEAFDAYTRGKTLFYSENGRAYGVELYRDNRRVQWSFLDGDCKDGIWYPEDEHICFVYEDNPVPQCWLFFLGPSGLSAQFKGAQSQIQLQEAQDVDDEMVCLGPEIGV